jgi:DNA-binding transcriptional MocR family regulator
MIMASPLTIRLATRFISDGTVQASTLAVREEARSRQKIAAQVITRSTFVSKPDAFHLWLSVPAPWSRVEFANHLRANGVGVIVSDTFTVTGAPPSAVRVGLGGPNSREECRHMLEIIDDALEYLPAAAAQ